MNWLDKFILIWSKQGRSTIELNKVNIFYERFNNLPDFNNYGRHKKKNQILKDILSEKWNYHIDKIEILLQLIFRS